MYFNHIFPYWCWMCFPGRLTPEGAACGCMNSERSLTSRTLPLEKCQTCPWTPTLLRAQEHTASNTRCILIPNRRTWMEFTTVQNTLFPFKCTRFSSHLKIRRSLKLKMTTSRLTVSMSDLFTRTVNNFYWVQMTIVFVLFFACSIYIQPWGMWRSQMLQIWWM